MLNLLINVKISFWIYQKIYFTSIITSVKESPMKILPITQTRLNSRLSQQSINNSVNITQNYADICTFTSIKGDEKRSYIERLKADLKNDFGESFNKDPDIIINQFLDPTNAKRTPDGFMYAVETYTQPRNFKFKDLGIDENILLNRIFEAEIVDLSDSNASGFGGIKKVFSRVILRQHQVKLIEQAEKLGFNVKFRI